MLRPSFRLLAAIVFVAVGSVDATAGERDVASLARQLKDADAHKASEAAQALRALGKDAAPAVPALVEALSDRRSPVNEPFPVRPTVGSYAGEALVAIGAPAVPALVERLNSRDVGVRRAALWRLQEIGEPAKAAVPRMKALVENDPSPAIKLAALGAYFAAAPKDDALPDILGRLLTDPTPEVRGYAAQLAGAIGPRAAVTIPKLRRLLEDDANESVAITPDFSSLRAVRSDAARALGEIGPASKSAVGRLTEMMTSDPDHEVRASAALAVFRIENGSPAALNALIAGLKDDGDTPSDPEAAADALAELGPKAAPAMEALVELLPYHNEFVRSASVAAIAAIGGPEAVKRVASALDDEDQMVQQTAADKLGDLGPAAAPAVPRLIELTRDSDDVGFLVRHAAIEALGKIGSAAGAALPALQAIAKAEPDSTDGQLAAEAVERISAAE
jgi:HEAT repeat protein